MIRSRVIKVALSLLLIIAAVGAYLHRNLDDILQQQVREALGEFGIRAYELEEPRLRGRLFTADQLRLHGRYEQYDYDISLIALEVRYDWRSLLTGQVHSVDVQELSARVTDHGAATDPDTAENTLVEIDSLLPQEWLDALPAQSLAIKRLRLDYSSPDGLQFLASGALVYRDRLDLSLTTAFEDSQVAFSVNSGERPRTLNALIEISNAERPVASLSARLAPLPLQQWQWQLEGRWANEPLLGWLRDLAPENDVMQGLTASGEGELNARIKHPGTLAIEPGALWPQLHALEASVSLTNAVTGLQYPGFFTDFKGNLAAELSLSAGRLQASLAPGEWSGLLAGNLIALSEDSRKWLRWEGDIPLRWENRLPLLVRFDGTDAIAETDSNQLTLGNAHSLLSLDNLKLDASLETDHASTARVSLQSLIKTTLRKQPLPALKLALQQQGPVERSSLSLALMDVGRTLSVTTDGEMHLGNAQGELHVAAQSSNLSALSADLLPAWRALNVLNTEVTLESGAFELQTQLSAGQRWKQQSELTLTNLSGVYDEYRFDGLSLDAAWDGIEEVQTTRPISLSIENLNAGFDIADLTVSANLPKRTPLANPALRVNVFNASVFGGELLLPEPVSWDFAAPSNTLTLMAKRWDLGEVVALQQSEDIEAQGVLEGELPVTIANSRIIVENGFMRALPPGGTIKYNSNEAGQALGSGSQELDMALRLLSDFRYDIFDAAVELDSAGTLLLGLSLAGRNPQEFDGRQVNFNINLEQNLDPVLQSLRLSGKLTEEIENRLQ